MGLLTRTNNTSPSHQEHLRVDSRPTPWASLMIGGSMAALILTSGLVAAFVKVDQIVPVPGKLQPIRTTQEFSPPELGVVSEVLVSEGETVAKGQAMVRLNPVILKGKQVALQEQRGEIRVISQAEMDRLNGAIGEAESEIQGLEAEKQIIREQLASLEKLEQEGAASKFQLLDYLRQLTDVNARLSSTQQSLQRLRAESKQKQAELRQQASENRADRVETEQRLRQVVIRASLEGTILNLKAKPGLVATVDEVLLELVPSDNLEATVYVSNQDLAFIRPGQNADLAIKAYDSNKFGRIPATVVLISTDSLPPDDVYDYFHFPINLKLSKQVLEYRGRAYPLQAGMAVEAHLKLEQRTLLGLLLSTISRGGDAIRTIR